MSFEHCLGEGGAVGKVGQLDYRGIKLSGFELAFNMADDKMKNSKYQLRVGISKIVGWGRMILALREAQKKADMEEVDYCISKMIKRNQKDKEVWKLSSKSLSSESLVPLICRAEYELNMKDGIYRRLKSVIEQNIKNGAAREETRLTNWCVMPEHLEMTKKLEAIAKKTASELPSRTRAAAAQQQQQQQQQARGRATMPRRGGGVAK